jgi:hypothetical protein
MESPINAFLNWYQTLPIPHRQDIAAFVVGFNPGFEGVDTPGPKTLVSNFEEKLKSYSNDKLFGVGVSLSLRSCIEFFFIRKRGSREGWQEIKGFLEGAKEHFTKEGKDSTVESAERYLREVPFREEQWIATCKKWDDIRTKEFSDDYIDRWWSEP